MKAVSCNQRNGGHRKALCPGTPQGPAQYQFLAALCVCEGGGEQGGDGQTSAPFSRGHQYIYFLPFLGEGID